MEISPVNRPKSAAKKTYNLLSRVYDGLAGSSEAPSTLMGLEILKVYQGERVLEIGSGTGRALTWLCGQVKASGEVHGIDLSRGMLQMAQKKLANSTVSCRISLVEGDGACLPYAGERFNTVFLSFTLELFDTPEIPTVLGECARVLKPGGRLGVVSLFKDSHPGAIVRMYEWFHKTLPGIVDCRPINTSSLIQASGFELKHRIMKSMWGLPVEILVATKIQPGG